MGMRLCGMGFWNFIRMEINTLEGVTVRGDLRVNLTSKKLDVVGIYKQGKIYYIMIYMYFLPGYSTCTYSHGHQTK